MLSRKFFGNYKVKDIHVELYNAKNEKIYENHCTTFANAKPLIKDEIKFAIECYKSDWVYKGEPTKCEIFTTPACNECIIDLISGKKIFKNC